MLRIEILPHSHPFASNTYLLTSADECAVIDPSSPYDESYVKGKVKYIFLTHAHFDHMLDIDEWVEKTGATVLVSEHDYDALADSEKNCYMLLTHKDKGYYGRAEKMKDSNIYPLGHESIKVISTPGHTPGSVSLLAGSSLFVGDTIFAGGGYGKCCFPGGDFAEIRKSIIKILWLDENITVYPGHDGKTTIKEYKKDYLR
ncbi:MAG: MBL fold metallo-hydrolase [Clostridia bacterium]|nr:MBL fold metallo-hydrolase [Clostridia bacterium]